MGNGVGMVFNPTKEEFEQAMRTCVTMTELLYYFSVDRATINRYVYKTYNHMTLESCFRIYKSKLSKAFQINSIELERLCALGYRIDDIAKRFGATSQEVAEWCRKTYGKEFSVVRDACLMHTRSQVRELQLQQMKDRTFTRQNVDATIWFAKQIDEQRDTKGIDLTTDTKVSIEAKPDVFDKIAEKLDMQDAKVVDVKSIEEQKGGNE